MSWSENLFGSAEGSLPLGGTTWRAWQDEQISAAGASQREVRLGAGVMASAGFLEALRMNVTPSAAARAVVKLGPIHAEFGENTLGGLARDDDTLHYDLVIGDAESRPRATVVDQLKVRSRSSQPGRMSQPITAFSGDRFIWSINHWYDLLVANLLVVQGRTAALESNIIAATANVHSTATVEHSVIDDGAVIGPYAVVRNSEIRAGSRVEEYTSIRGSILGENTVVQTQSLVHGSTVGGDTVVSFHTAIRSSVLFGNSTISAPVVARSVIGPNTFLARGVSLSASTLADTPVSVRVGSRSVSTGARLVGCAVGKEARIGNGICLPAGYAVPAGIHLIDRPIPRLDPDVATQTPLLLDAGRFRPLPTLKGPTQ